MGDDAAAPPGLNRNDMMPQSIGDPCGHTSFGCPMTPEPRIEPRARAIWHACDTRVSARCVYECSLAARSARRSVPLRVCVCVCPMHIKGGHNAANAPSLRRMRAHTCVAPGHPASIASLMLRASLARSVAAASAALSVPASTRILSAAPSL